MEEFIDEILIPMRDTLAAELDRLVELKGSGGTITSDTSETVLDDMIEEKVHAIDKFEENIAQARRMAKG